MFIDRGLFKLLIELSGIDEPNIAEPAQILLKKLSIYIFNFLPDSSKYIDFLISAASKNDSSSHMLKYSSAFVINKIGNYIFDDRYKIKNTFIN
jgi:hypothetical protein